MSYPHGQVAYNTLKAGHKAQARALLTQAVQQDEHNEQAWLWLSGAVDTDAERRACLQRVLAINPHNAAARRGLAALQASAGARPPAPQVNLAPAAQSPATTRTNALNTTPDRTRPTALRNEAEKKQFWQLIGLVGVLGLLMLGLAIVLSLTGGETEDARLSRIEPLYELPYVAVYGRKACGRMRRMMEDLDQSDIPYTFKSMDDQSARDEVFPRMRAAGLSTRRFLLPVVDVNGWMLLDTSASAVVDRYHAP